jgi:hypothetical protein
VNMTSERVPNLVDLMVDWLYEAIGRGHNINTYHTSLVGEGYVHVLHVDGKRIGWVHTTTGKFECTATSKMLNAADPDFFDKVWESMEDLEASARGEPDYDPTYDRWLTTYKE